MRQNTGAVLAVAAFLLLVGCIPTEISTPQRSTPPTVPQPTQPRAWQQVASWSGRGTKSTPKFTVGKEWAIEWDTRPGQYGEMNFQVFVYNADGSFDGIEANIIGADHDKSYKHRAGTYYLTINTSQPWQIVIWEHR